MQEIVSWQTLHDWLVPLFCLMMSWRGLLVIFVVFLRIVSMNVLYFIFWRFEVRSSLVQNTFSLLKNLMHQYHVTSIPKEEKKTPHVTYYDQLKLYHRASAINWYRTLIRLIFSYGYLHQITNSCMYRTFELWGPCVHVHLIEWDDIGLSLLHLKTYQSLITKIWHESR